MRIQDQECFLLHLPSDLMAWLDEQVNAKRPSLRSRREFTVAVFEALRQRGPDAVTELLIVSTNVQGNSLAPARKREDGAQSGERGQTETRLHQSARAVSGRRTATVSATRAKRANTATRAKA